MHRIEFSKGAQRAFRKLGQDIQKRIDPVIQDLAQNPRPPNCKKLSSKEPLWRVRAGDYRIIYQVFDDRLLARLPQGLFKRSGKAEVSAILLATCSK